MKLDKIIFAVDDNPEYDNFWEINSEICNKKLGVTPVLFRISDRETDFINDTYGIVKYVKSIPGVDTGFQAQIYRMYGTKYFPNEIIMTSDIDMLLFSRDYIQKSIGDLSDEDMAILNSDAYDNTRPECVGIFSGDERYPICYVVAKGSTFTKVINNDVTFSEYCSRLLELNLAWDTDEIYFGRCVNSQRLVKVHKISRGYSSNFYCPNRIEKHNFQSSGIFSIDLEKNINIDSFIDCHCARPYISHKVAIDNIRDKVLSSSKKEVYLIGCHVENERQKELLYELVNFLSLHNKPFVICSHTSIPEDIINNSVGYVYDSINPKYKSWNLPGFPKFRFESDSFTIDAPHISWGSENYYHVGVMRLIINGIKYLMSTDYEIVHWIEYDSLPDLEMDSTANVRLDYNDFIFYGIGSRFSFLKDKVNSKLIEMNDEEILSALSQHSYLAERLISNELIDGEKYTQFLDESKRELWGRYSQNFDARNLNWSIFNNKKNLDFFLHNISNQDLSIDVSKNHQVFTIKLPPYNWYLGTLGLDTKEFSLTTNGVLVIDVDLTKERNLIQETIYTQK